MILIFTLFHSIFICPCENRALEGERQCRVGDERTKVSIRLEDFKSIFKLRRIIYKSSLGGTLLNWRAWRVGEGPFAASYLEQLNKKLALRNIIVNINNVEID